MSDTNPTKNTTQKTKKMSDTNPATKHNTENQKDERQEPRQKTGEETSDSIKTVDSNAFTLTHGY